MLDSTPEVAPASPLASSRRSVLKAAAWTVPVVSVASATPAFASSACTNGVAGMSGWSITAGSLNNGNANTGWLVRAQLGQSGYISTSEAQYFTSTANPIPSGSSNQPDGSFLSFANNGSTTLTTTVLVRYQFTVTGTASVTLNGNLKIGYGNSGRTPNVTERQLVDVSVREGTGVATSIAKIAHRRRTGTNNNNYVYL